MVYARQEESREQALDRRVPFWSSKSPEITTCLGKSTYRFSGYHAQKLSNGTLTLDTLSIVGELVDGPDLGPIMMTLAQPVETRVTRAGGFKSNATLILTSGSHMSSIEGVIEGKLGSGVGGFESLCVSANAKESVISLAQGAIATQLSVGTA